MADIPLDAIDIISLIFDAPLTLLLFYFLMQERKEHANTRVRLAEIQDKHADKYAMLAEKVVQAVQRLDLPGPL